MKPGTGVPSLVAQLSQSLTALGLNPPPLRIESLAVGIYCAMGGPRRRFHTLDHLFQFEPTDALESVAVLYHDVVYWPVDGGWPEGWAGVLSSITPSGTPGSVLALQSGIPYYAEILAVFGLAPGGTLAKVGINEVLSALAFSSALGADLGRERVLAVAACLETTIPFRGPSAIANLKTRLLDLGFDRRTTLEMLARAARMTNQDLANFRAEDPGVFLAGTWKLLPELNPELRLSEMFTVSAYGRALAGMHKFLTFLKPEMLFVSSEDEPGEIVFSKWHALAEENLATARRYIGAKLLASSLLEAFALATGPEVPLALLMGAAADAHSERLDSRLPALHNPVPTDKVWPLLETGRPGSVSFDLSNSPLAAWIYRQLPAGEFEGRLEQTRGFLEGKTDPRGYLSAWPSELISRLAGALSDFVPTRRQALEEWR